MCYINHIGYFMPNKSKKPGQLDTHLILTRAASEYLPFQVLQVQCVKGGDGLYHALYGRNDCSKTFPKDANEVSVPLPEVLKDSSCCQKCLRILVLSTASVRLDTLAQRTKMAMDAIKLASTAHGPDELLEACMKADLAIHGFQSFVPELSSWAESILKHITIGSFREVFKNEVAQWVREVLESTCPTPENFLQFSQDGELEEGFAALRSLYVEKLLKQKGFHVVSGIRNLRFGDYELRKGRVAFGLLSFYEVAPALHVFPTSLVPWVKSIRNLSTKCDAYVDGELTPAQIETLVAFYDPRGSGTYSKLPAAVSAAVALES